MQMRVLVPMLQQDKHKELDTGCALINDPEFTKKCTWSSGSRKPSGKGSHSQHSPRSRLLICRDLHVVCCDALLGRHDLDQYRSADV